VLAWLFSLFGRRSQGAHESPIDEEAAYANSYGDRGGDVLTVARLPEPEPEPEEAPSANGDLTGEFLRRAFEKKLDARSS
jgi:hypothetical protein